MICRFIRAGCDLVTMPLVRLPYSLRVFTSILLMRETGVLASKLRHRVNHAHRPQARLVFVERAIALVPTIFAFALGFLSNVGKKWESELDCNVCLY